MAEHKPVNRIPVGVVAGISAAVVAAAGGAAWWTINSHQSPPTPPPVTTITPTSPPLSPVSPPAQTAQIYWLKDTGKSLELIAKPVTLAADQPSDAVLRAAFDNLLAGPNEAAISSTIPERTKLRDVSIEPDGVHVDLSQEFTTGGGSASMMGRVAQVLYTATTLQPNAKVWINVEGKPLETLGGEGLELEQPLTRQSFQENFTL